MSLEDAKQIDIMRHMAQASANATHQATSAAGSISQEQLKRWDLEDQRRDNANEQEARAKIEAAKDKVAEVEGSLFQTYVNAFAKGRSDSSILFQMMMQMYQYIKVSEHRLKTYVENSEIIAEIEKRRSTAAVIQGP